MSKMIEMKVRGVLGSPLGFDLFLGEKTEKTCKVIVMGIDSSVAAGINAALYNQKTPRPLTHELMEGSLKALGARADRIEITEIRDGTFIGNLVIVNNLNVESHLDSRPSDGIAMALRFCGRILVSEEVFDKTAEIMPKEIEELLSKEKTH